MNAILIGAIALGVAVLGLVVHLVRFFATREVSLSVLWLIAPTVGAVVAFLMTPASLLTVSLGGASLLLAFLTLAAAFVAPLTTGQEAEQPRRQEREDRAA